MDRRCHFKHVSLKQSRFYRCKTSTAHRKRNKVHGSVAIIGIKFPYRPTRDVSLLSGHASYITAYNIQKSSKRPLDLASLAHPPAVKEMVADRDLYSPPVSVLYGYRTGSIISIRRKGPETETKYSTPTIVRVIVNRHTDTRETDPTG